MFVFVKSAGSLRIFDYVWIGQNTQAKSLGKLCEADVKKIIPGEVWNLISTDEQSILLFQTEKGSCFLATKLPSKRHDFASRRISNAVGFFAENFEDRENLRRFFSSFLVSPLSIQNQIDDLILDSPKEPGYDFSGDKIEELITKNLDNKKKDEQVNLSSGLVFPDTPNSYKEISGQILAISEKNVGPVFLYREYEDEKFFQENKVWRGISKLVKEKSAPYDILKQDCLNYNSNNSTHHEYIESPRPKIFDGIIRGGKNLYTSISKFPAHLKFKKGQSLEDKDPRRAKVYYDKAEESGVIRSNKDKISLHEKEGNFVEAVKLLVCEMEGAHECNPEVKKKYMELWSKLNDDEKKQVDEFIKNEKQKAKDGANH